MSEFQNKVDFAAIVTVTRANSNGDPLNGNRPRTDYNGYGEISDVCIKRKIRNRMQDMGIDIFVQSDDHPNDGLTSLSERAKAGVGKVKDRNEYAIVACNKWLDVRSFGQVFAFKSDNRGVSAGVRGPVSIHQAISVSPVEVRSMQITKCVNSEPSEKRSSDTMGAKHYVRFGVYIVKGSINVQLCKNTGFSQADAEVIKECLKSLFDNDASAARPEGSMEVSRLYWWQHNCARTIPLRKGSPLAACHPQGWRCDAREHKRLRHLPRKAAWLGMRSIRWSIRKKTISSFPASNTLSSAAADGH